MASKEVMPETWQEHLGGVGTKVKVDLSWSLAPLSQRLILIKEPK